MARIKFVSKPGIFEQAFNSISADTIDAAYQSIVEVGEIAKAEARADILAAGLGNRFAKALRLNIYPKRKKSINASAQIFHKIPYAGVFDEGANIRGKPLMWVPLPNAPQKVDRKPMTPKLFVERVGPLFLLKRPGHPPLLMAKTKEGKGKTKDKVVIRRIRSAVKNPEGAIAVPIFVGLPSVDIRKRLNTRAIIKRARDRLPEIFASKFKG